MFAVNLSSRSVSLSGAFLSTMLRMSRVYFSAVCKSVTGTPFTMQYGAVLRFASLPYGQHGNGAYRSCGRKCCQSYCAPASALLPAVFCGGQSHKQCGVGRVLFRDVFLSGEIFAQQLFLCKGRGAVVVGSQQVVDMLFIVFHDSLFSPFLFEAWPARDICILLRRFGSLR